MVKKVAIITNGGDCPGLNAVIRAIVKSAETNGVECYGYIEIIVFRLTYNRLEVAIKIDMYNLNLEFSFFICIFVILRFLRKN